MSAPSRPPSRPPFDPVALVLGTLFVLVAVLGLIDAELARDLDLGVLVPTTLVVLGGGLVLGAALSGRRPPERDRDGPVARG